MSNKKKMNPKARGIYIVCLVIAEIVAFAIFKTNSTAGAGLIGGGAALVAFLVSKFIAESQGIEFYTEIKQNTDKNQ